MGKGDHHIALTRFPEVRQQHCHKHGQITRVRGGGASSAECAQAEGVSASLSEPQGSSECPHGEDPPRSSPSQPGALGRPRIIGP
jgi:hypothetical protein